MSKHFFFECRAACHVWSKLCSWWKFLPSNPPSLEDFCNHKITSSYSKAFVEVQEAIILTFMWVLWRFKILKIHSNDPKSHTTLVTEIQILSFLWINARKKKTVLLYGSSGAMTQSLNAMVEFNGLYLSPRCFTSYIIRTAEETRQPQC